ncbi:MAG: carboxypeptidase regulatory-like domain-containing protein, partial [Acidobacteria bacterium]|nr:carboxypeptidase regulatory-like domain-containing protein [Acidobacteriota bacterium]
MVSIATVVLLAFAAGADAPAGAPEPKPTPTPPPVLQGVVKDPRGKPVEKALVVARCTDRYGEPLLQARTDASGRFRLAVAGSGPCDVRVEARGLASVRLERVRPGPPLAVTLAKGGAIEGTVRDAAGQPVPGARVEASWSRSVTWDPDAGAVSVSTDARGRFRLEGIGRGLHEITGRLRGAGSARR